MRKVTIVSAAALTLAVLAFNAPAMAETANNMQTGAHTSNAYDTAASADAKQAQNQGSYFSSSR